MRPHRFERPHGEQVSHHCREAGSEAALGDETQLEFREADDVVALLPVPRRNVQEVSLQQ